MQSTSFTSDDFDHGFVVAVTIEAKPGEENRVAALLQGLIAPTMAEPGVKLFLPYRSPTNRALFFIYELYVDEAGWGAHQNTKHFLAAIKHLLPCAARRERIPYLPFAAQAAS
jgi:quinol monooxygenase YgiN